MKKLQLDYLTPLLNLWFGKLWYFSFVPNDGYFREGVEISTHTDTEEPNHLCAYTQFLLIKHEYLRKKEQLKCNFWVVLAL